MAIASTTEITRLIGVYDADGTTLGELKYWVAARLGRAHCALCDITHGPVREKAEWRECRRSFGVTFDTYHRDDQPDAVRAAVAGRTPVVVAESSGGFVELLGPSELEACKGSGEALVQAIEQQVATRWLNWPNTE